MNKNKFFMMALLAIVGSFFSGCSDDDKQASGIPVAEITVAEATAGSGDLKELTVDVNATLLLTTTVLPENAAYKRVLYSTQGEGIVSVNQSGVLTGLKAGTDILVIQAADGGGATASYQVTVIQQLIPATAIMLAQDEVTVAKGATFELSGIVSLQPNIADQSAVTYESQNEDVVTVDASSGSLMAVSVGETMVTVSTTDGSNLKKDIAIRVENKQTYEIAAATAVGAWVTTPLVSPLPITEKWIITAVSTQSSGDINQVTFGSSGWGIHLFDMTYTGSAENHTGNQPPFEFYLGGTLQGGNKIGAIGRANWKNSTMSLDPFAITLDTPVTIKLVCDGEGSIACTVQNSGVNDGAPIDFGTITGIETITAVKAAVPVVTNVTVEGD
ncbi:MAG: Ig-like domain-containing protein [Dysgonamonadaceae bacterium]|jgi:hypothetical protein|nr:Ig-like domain-containing protein [Dysgonamonadaceae bacterium]